MSERLQQLLKFYESDPGDAFCAYGIALEHAKAGRHGEAVEWLDKTLRTDPDYAYAYFQKAKIFGEMGRNEEARAVIAEGVAAANRKGDAHAAEELEGLRQSLEG